MVEVKSKDDMIRKIDNHKIGVSLSSLQYWVYQLCSNPSNSGNIITEMRNVYERGLKEAIVKQSVDTLLNIDLECLFWLKENGLKDDLNKIIEKLEVSLKS